MTNDFYVLMERRKTKSGIENFVVGYSESGVSALHELSRLYHMNPFETNKYFLEMRHYKPIDAYCFDR